MNAGAPSLVAPFRALRYAPTTQLDRLISPPYDVITAERRMRLAAQDPHNVVHLVLPESDGNPYTHASHLLHAWRDAGVLVRDAAASVSVIRQQFRTPDGAVHERTGVIGGLHVEPYETKRVRPHERTHRGPKEDRLALFRATNAMLESIFVLAPDADGRLRNALTDTAASTPPPTATATLDGVRTQVWRVTGTRADEIATAAGADPLYIADGHHRFETANIYREESPAAARIPALVVPVGDPGLVVLPTHRIVSGATGDTTPLIDEWRHRYRVEDVALDPEPENIASAVAGSGPSCVVVFPGGAAYRVSGSARDAATPVIAEVDERIVKPLEAALTGSVSYTASAQEAIHAARGGAGVAVLVPPTPLDVVLAVSDAGGVMPPKSTYFAPKVPSGLVIMSYEDA